jgi:hypothetical protein
MEEEASGNSDTGSKRKTEPRIEGPVADCGNCECDRRQFAAELKALLADGGNGRWVGDRAKMRKAREGTGGEKAQTRGESENDLKWRISRETGFRDNRNGGVNTKSRRIAKISNQMLIRDSNKAIVAHTEAGTIRREKSKKRGERGIAKIDHFQ